VLRPDSVDESVGPIGWKLCPNYSKFLAIVARIATNRLSYGIFCHPVPGEPT
jgi:hypothetical protein